MRALVSESATRPRPPARMHRGAAPERGGRRFCAAGSRRAIRSVAQPGSGVSHLGRPGEGEADAAFEDPPAHRDLGVRDAACPISTG